MKLVTFAPPNAPPRAGALIDNGRLVVDLAASHRDTFGEPFPAFAQVLTIIEGGDDALDRAYETLKSDTAAHQHALAGVKLLSPIPQPPQMRDCLCFELHLVQAFNAARQLKANRSQDPAAAPNSPPRMLDMNPPPPLPMSASNVSAATRVDAMTRSMGSTDRYTALRPT